MKGTESRTCWTTWWMTEAFGCPRHPADLGRAVWSVATSCGQKLLTSTAEQEIWGEHPGRLYPWGFPEVLTQIGLHASPRPPGRLETFILLPLTCPPKIHSISEYTPIYSFLRCHLSIRGCFPLTPANCGITFEVEVIGHHQGEWAGSQMGVQFSWPYCSITVCIAKLQINTMALWVPVYHADSAFSAFAGIPWLRPGRAVHAVHQQPPTQGIALSHQTFPCGRSSSVDKDILLFKRPRCAVVLSGRMPHILDFDLQL